MSSWYPNKKDALDGNFVQNHARAVSSLVPVTVLFATSLKDLSSTYVLEDKKQNNFREIRVYFKWSPWKIIRLFRTLYAYFLGIKKVQPFDILHANVFFNSGVLAVILGFWKKKPVVLSEHSSWFNTVEKIPLWKRKMLQIFQKGIIFFMPVSQNLGNKLIELGVDAHKIYPVPNVIDTNVFFYKLLPANQKTTFLHVSNFKENHKNIEGILKVIARLDAMGLDFQFIFLGDGDIERIKQKSQKLKINQNKIVFYTTKTGPDLAYYYQLADAFVLFSRYENLPCVLLESLCCGTPIIATNVGGVSEIIENNGYMIESEDENALCETMIRFIDKKTSFEKLEISKHAQSLYSVSAISLRIETLYRETFRFF